MKPLSQMTREELWDLDGDSIKTLCIENGVDMFYDYFGRPIERDWFDLIGTLDSIREQLQQSSAEARRDTKNER